MRGTGRVWIFDLDNTLHNATPYVFPHISRSMTAYLATALELSDEEASALRVSYWRRYGATLLGMMRHHGTNPHHFLLHTHQFPDLRRMLVFESGLRAALRRLPGRKLVFSNSPLNYAEAVLDVVGVRREFDGICAIEQMRFQPKPARKSFQTLMHDHRLKPGRCILVEDSVENLRTAKALGMKTVWVTRAANKPAHVDLRIQSILDLPRKIGRRI